MVPFEQDVQGFILQLLEALSFAHERNIAHLDIKPQNIVLMSEFPNCEIKLCDLEVSRVIQEHEEIREIIGTPDYVAPEILAYEPISLAADIWSLGVLAYVLLTGFSPFGGETDQETLRNITSATLDFPAELFEGVTEEAKEFIKECLNRNPKDRPTVKQCLQHPWVARDSEPPSPSPLMLKIPAPDHFVTSPKLSVHHLSPSGSSRRSCQTCRDKLSERKRYLSKSREAIFEKVTNSNLKKSLSKSRERLCDMRLTLGKSREYLNDSKLASRSQEKFYSFKSISKSQEVLSQGLGGNMKRTNGAVSDISPHHLPVNPRVYLDTPDNCDFVMLPGSSVLMSHSELMSITGIKNAGSLQLLAISESGRSTPASLCSNATVADIPYSGSSSGEPCNDNICPTNNTKSVCVETLVEVAEEECDEYDNRIKSGQHNQHTREKASSNQHSNNNNHLNGGRRKSTKQETPVLRKCSQKDEKNNINYVTKQSLTRGANSCEDSNIKSQKNSTAEVAIQVDQEEFSSTPVNTVLRRKEKKQLEKQSSNSHLDSSMLQVDGNMRPSQQEKKLTRGFSHDNTLGIGDEHKRYSWREDLEKFRSMKKPLAVSDLIDAFSTNSMQRKVSADDPSFPNVDALKNKRRGSLQIQIDPKSLANLTERSATSENNVLKTLRRKSTSAILPLRLSEVKPVDIDETSVDASGKQEEDTNLSGDVSSTEAKSNPMSDQTVSEADSVESDVNNTGSCESITLAYFNQSLPKGRIYLEKVNERKRTWDYFEINHPKAISDKKLAQLKAKYTRRKTEADILSNSSKNAAAVDKNSNDKPLVKSSVSVAPSPVRTQSMSVFEGLVGSPLPKKPLDLAFDPLTGECLSAETESVDSGRESEVVRKLSSDSSEESSSRKSSKSGGVMRKSSSHLGDILESEQLIPEEVVLECFIDPFTGQFITNEVAKTQDETEDEANKNQSSVNKNYKNKDAEPKSNNIKNLKVICDSSTVHQDDDGIGSLPITPTDLGKNKSLSVLKKPINEDRDAIATDDGIFTSSEETISFAPRPGCCNESVSSEDGNDSNGNIRRPPLSQDTQVCSGSVSRGLEKFKGKEHQNSVNNNRET